MSIFIGFHTSRTIAGSNLESKPNDDPENSIQLSNSDIATMLNVMNAVGYLPILGGIVVGVMRICESGDRAHTPAQKVMLCVRGIFEILGVGIYF